MRNGVVRLATIASVVGIAAMRSRPVRPWRRASSSCRIGAAIADDAARPIQHPLALGREAAEAGAAIDQQHAHRRLELLHPGRQRRLGHAAGLRGAAEMPLPGQRQKEFELIDQCDSPSLIAVRSYPSSIENINRSMAIGGLFLINGCRHCWFQKDSNHGREDRRARHPVRDGATARGRRPRAGRSSRRRSTRCARCSASASAGAIC